MRALHASVMRVQYFVPAVTYFESTLQPSKRFRRKDIPAHLAAGLCIMFHSKLFDGHIALVSREDLRVAFLFWGLKVGAPHVLLHYPLQGAYQS